MDMCEKLIDLAENGVISWETIAREALAEMSVDDCECMARMLGIDDEDEDDDVIKGIPQWAMCGIINDDWSGVGDDDEKLAKDWLKENVYNLGYAGLSMPIDGSENEFDLCPAFGDACATVDCRLIKNN